MERQKRIYRVTIAGGIVNAILLVLKFALGIIGHSSAMIADAVHSLSDFVTDIIVLLFVRISHKPKDETHDYGHGKYETLATTLIGIALVFVGAMICYSGAEKVYLSFQGIYPEAPGIVALVAALVSIAAKEWVYRFTIRVGRKVESEAVIANAWHHRSDALSSIGTSVGIGGAILLGNKWTILDPIAAIIVSFFILRVGYNLTRKAVGQLLERSLSPETEKEIEEIVLAHEGVSDLHHLCTRSLGNRVAIEMHIRMPGSVSLYESHQRATEIERSLKKRFGEHTHISLHVEPEKVDGQYVCPCQTRPPAL